MPDNTQTSKENSRQTTLSEAGFRPLTRPEQRNMWLKEYGEQDLALQAWVKLVEQQGLEIDIMLQMGGLLVFGVMVSTQSYAQFYIDLHEDMYRKDAPDTADFLRDYYSALVPAPDQPEIGAEGLPLLFHYAHLRDVTMMSAGHKIKVPYWRGKVNQVDAFVIGASAGD